ncbi:helix-turn-helix transcriptional regulator [Actinomadura barringtoniae]|uniref:Helix-turn-helix transcriptional regulator n=2 Tax=Actinomadura barringtoniae TaxID=1427535 RepID=A0A939TCE2_9ACTN|nr:helix-turn-helix transcriptional regulator [Actinomadura barringtoniae]
MTAAADVLHRQGVERTTIADIAEAADVPVGNVYYYFKTKDELVQAALATHSEHFAALTAELDELPDPLERLKAMVGTWIDQRDVAARYGCPTGTLAAELDKRADGGIDLEAGEVIKLALNWAERQFRELGRPEPEPADLALTLISGYQGMSLMANALRDPEIMTREGSRLNRWLDALAADRPPAPGRSV